MTVRACDHGSAELQYAWETLLGTTLRCKIPAGLVVSPAVVLFRHDAREKLCVRFVFSTHFSSSRMRVLGVTVVHTASAISAYMRIDLESRSSDGRLDIHRP